MLRVAIACVAVLSLAPSGARASAQGRRPPDALHVILVIGDGMSRATEVAASRFLHGRDDGLAWHRFEVQAFASTWDVTTYDRRAAALGLPPWSPTSFLPEVGYDVLRAGAAPWPLRSVPGADGWLLEPLPLPGGDARIPATDSASSATAMATGVKTDGGNIAWRPGDPPGGALVTIAQRARARGAAIGVVTTVPFSHATPAAFVAHSPRRDAYDELAHEILFETRPEVVIGGGASDPPATDRSAAVRWASPEDRAAARRPGSGWVVVERGPRPDAGRRLLEAARALPRGQRLLGLFGAPEGNFEPPVAQPDGTIRRGSGADPSLAEAAVAALTVLSRARQGLFLVVEQGDIDWANHDGDLPRAIGTTWDLDQAVRAVEAFVDRPGDAITWENTLLVVTADHANGHLRLGSARGAGVLPGPGDFTWGAPGVNRSPGHTSELVTLAARGAGAGRIAAFQGRWYPMTRIVDDTQLHEAMLEALGLEPAALGCPPALPRR